MNKNYGLTEAAFHSLLSILQAHLKIKQKCLVYVFGSRARGDEKKYSDIDLWIETSPSLNKSELAQMNEAFETSTIPITVDIVTPESVLTEYRENILKERVLWFST